MRQVQNHATAVAEYDRHATEFMTGERLDPPRLPFHIERNVNRRAGVEGLVWRKMRARLQLVDLGKRPQ